MHLLVTPNREGLQYYAMQAICYTLTITPLGPMLLAGDEEGLRVASFQTGRHPTKPEPWWRLDPAPLREAAEQLEGYFRGDLREFTLTLNPGGTGFQRSVWRELCHVRFGQTTTYGEVARRLGKGSGAARAVGAASGANPISIIIPCHRVVAGGGRLTGYASGLSFKEYLLRHEGACIL